jgi:hypothetical protein
MALATLIVAPTYLAQIMGVTAVQISARKIKLMDANLKPLAECKRQASDDMTKDFAELVALVRARATQA